MDTWLEQVQPEVLIIAYRALLKGVPPEGNAYARSFVGSIMSFLQMADTLGPILQLDQYEAAVHRPRTKISEPLTAMKSKFFLVRFLPSFCITKTEND